MGHSHLDRVGRELPSRRFRGSWRRRSSVTGGAIGECTARAPSSALNAGTPPDASSARSLSLAVTQRTPDPRRGEPRRGRGVARRKLGSVTWTSSPLLVPVVVAGDSVPGGADAGDDRDVVGVGERRDLRRPERVAAPPEPSASARRGISDSFECVVDVLGIPSVGADREHSSVPAFGSCDRSLSNVVGVGFLSPAWP